MSKFSILPVGTCRINTPLKRAAARYPVRVDLRRIYGFVHTSDEALQQLQYRFGSRSFPAEVLPILFRPGDAPDAQPPVADAGDLAVIEISSIKSCRAGDIAVQSNYLTRHFADFFGPARRVRRVQAYWDMARTGQRARLRAFLQADPVFSQYSPAEQELLAAITVRQQTFDDVLADMAAMVELVGRDRVLFVTHVNATTADGSLIASRDKLIRWVRQAAERLQVPCFDPTALMQEFGQDRAMQRGGLDLTHYTNAFSDRWYNVVQRLHIAHRLGADVELGNGASETQLLCDEIAQAIGQDDLSNLIDGSQRLFAALRRQPDSAPLQVLHGQLLARLGDHAGAARVLQPYAGSPDLSYEAGQALLHARLETGDAAGALEIAGELMRQEIDDVALFEAAGLAASQLGRDAEAVRLHKLAFRLDPARHVNAVTVLDHCRAGGDMAGYRLWLDEVATMLAGESGDALARGLAEWAIARRDGAVLRLALGALARNRSVVLPALLEQAARSGMATDLPQAVAQVMADAGGTAPGEVDRIMPPLRALARDWAASAEALLNAGSAGDAHALALASRTIVPNNGAARRVERAALDTLHARLRAARMAQDDAGVIAAAEAAGELVFERAESALAWADALVRQGRLEDAGTVAARLHGQHPDNIDVRAMLATVAALAGRTGAALTAWGDLLAAPALPERLRRRAQRFVETVARTGVRTVRALVGDGRIADAIALCDALDRYAGMAGQTTGERARIASRLRTQLRAPDPGDDSGKVLVALRQLLAVSPDDAIALRRAAADARALTLEGRFEDAVALCRLLQSSHAASQRGTEELRRILGAMRIRLRELEDDEADGEALRVVELMLDITPGDTALLRRAALEAMKNQDFATALGYWHRVAEAAPGLDSTDRNIVRCEILAQRQARSASVAAAAPLAA